MRNNEDELFRFFQRSSLKGFTLIEMLLVMSVAFTLLGIATINLANIQRESQLDAVVNTFLADMKEQQIKAMVGDKEGGSTPSDFGVHIDTDSYTVFRGSSYSASSAANFTVDLPGAIEISRTLPSQNLIFEQGSGNVSGFVSGQDTITVTDTGDSAQKRIKINRYGVIIEIN